MVIFEKIILETTSFMSKSCITFFFFILLMLVSCAGGKKARVREQKIDRIIQTARGYTGTPYKWGGTNRSGMDCSGLLIRSFESAQITIPRTSEAQSKLGKRVRIEDIEAGDLLFFATSKKKRKITHVGLVTAVRGRRDIRFIHSSSSLGVVETNLFSDYYLKHFRFARRIL